MRDRNAMTSPITSSNITPFRRYSDPPKLWLWVLAGSLFVHLLAGAAIRAFEDTSIIQPSTPIAVELLESADVTNGATPSQSVPSQETSQAPRSAEDVTTQTTISSPAIALTQSAELSTTLPASRSIQTTSPKKTVSSPPVDAANLKQPKRFTGAAAPTADSSAIKKNTIKEPAPSDSATSGDRLPNLPTVPDPSAIQESNRALTSVAIASTPAPAKFMAQFRAIALASNSSNSAITSIIAAQLLGEPTKSFSSDPSVCVLTPQALHSFSQPVMLKLPLDETGAFDPQKPVTVEQSSGNVPYDELAICTAKTSRFTPAYALNGTTKRAISSDLEIQVTLSQ